MRHLTLSAVLILALAAIAAAGPFGLFGRRHQCGPNGCQLRRAPEDAAKHAVEPQEVKPDGVLPVPRELPTQPNDSDIVPTPVTQNFGVDCSKIGPSRVTINGREVTMAAALDALAGGTIPDDSKKMRVTVIGSEAERKPVLDALSSDDEIKTRAIVWALPPDHFALKDLTTGKAIFKTDGHPTVYVQAPDGKVLHRQDEWRPEDVGAIRKAVKAYDSSKDPDLRKSESIPNVPKGLTTPVLCLAGIGALYFLLRARNAQ